ncbi:PREDICTED: protein timeless homolog isoform X2 [Nelumbo nucifera]|uniref:Protein timeless homolog isoform X2 n=1 Tax=Nelumbo nucifera TaxID=4432 RepID=A0A1U8A4V8_NELNU|nr:PREDICTED: protein timeless homolog isoform X2 [Nelumbo nucifera]
MQVLIFLTMPIEPTSSDISQQMEYLWDLKASITRNDTIAVVISLLEDPLENLERGAFTEDDWKLVQLVLTLFRNVLAVQEITLQQKAVGSATQYISLRDKFLELLFNENVMDLIMVLTQHVGGSCYYLRQDNLLLLEIFYYIFMGQEPELIAKASQKGSEVEGNVKESLDSLRSIMEEEEAKRRLTRQLNLDRHSQFSGTFTRFSMDGSKTLFKGNPGSASCDSLLKSHKSQRGPLKRIVWDHGKFSSPKDKILELLHNLLNQLLSGGYNVLMQSIREDIEKEHHAIQNSDVAIFFQVAQFVTAFQHHKSLIWKHMNVETKAFEAITNKDDSTFFQGEICGPIAATMDEAMFLLVTSKWRYAFDALKETNDYKFLSISGALMKNMICMLGLVLKLLPEDSKESRTARILLYKIFYDQTDQGMTPFLINLIKSFDTHKQPKGDLADLVEMIYLVVQIMEKLQARGTLRVSRKSRRGRKKKLLGDGKAAEEELLGDDNNSVRKEINSTCEPSLDSGMPLKTSVTNSSVDGKEENILDSYLVDEPEIPPLDTEILGEDLAQPVNKKSSHTANDLAYATENSSDDDQTVATDEVDFKISSLVTTFTNNTIIQNLCWLLKFYRSNSTTTNHHILYMLRRISDDLELSPMLYQLSLLTIFYDILAEQKSSPCKDYANIVSFLTDLVRKMLKKMKTQPLLFVEILFWKTRKECHYINSESLLHELRNLKRESKKWGNASSENEGQISSLQSNREMGRRSIADSLGEDEADIVFSHDLSYQKEENPDEMKLKNDAEINGEENNDMNDAYSEGHALEDHSPRGPQRKKRLVFDEELETDIKNLYEKYKDNRHCSRLIAEALEHSRKVSPVQVSNKLKQLGLKTSKKRNLCTGRDEHVMLEGKELGNDDTHLPLNGLEESSFRGRSSKRICAFSKEQELMVKDLFEQFKDHKRCSYMIAKALDADNTFTAAQVSHKLKQLGLLVPRKKRPSEGKKHLLDKHPKGLFSDVEEDKSDEETLISLMKRSKKSKPFFGDVATADLPKQNIEATSLQDYSDEELLISILDKTGKRHASKARDEKLTISSVKETAIGSNSTQGASGRDSSSQSKEAGLPHINDVALNVANLNQEAEFSGGGSDEEMESPVNNVSQQNINDELADEMVDSEDDVGVVARTSAVSRRKLKMVIDADDDE